MSQNPVEPPTTSEAPTPAWALGVAGVWLIGFLLYFNSFVLPNSPESFTRADIWMALPDVYSALVVNPPVRSQEQAGQPKWRYFPQRLDAIAVAGFVLLSAWGLGALLLRLLRVGSALTVVERLVFAMGLGLAAVSLGTLACGLAGILNQAVFVAGMAVFPIAAAGLWWRDRRASDATPSVHESTGDVWLRRLCVIAIVPFVMATALGAMLPSFDFDVKEYHLQGPKEYLENGQITFLPHNVYTSFPFLTEMLSLNAMVVRGDWYRGALAGKAILAAFSLLSALAVFAAGRRLFNPTAGWFGLLIYLTIPWTHRISIIAYAEGGLTFYLIAATLALTLAVRESQSSVTGAGRLFLLSGLLAGSAMGCKYPGVVQVVIPLGLAILVFPWIARTEPSARRRLALRSAGLFAVGAVLTIGPWLLKNLAETGNPVYPLLGSLVDSRDWDAELNAKWRAGHSPPHHEPADLVEKLIDVVARSDWQSGLVFAFAPLALLRPERRRAGWLWLFVGYLFLGWWVLTHRIDRFWIPLLPVASVLAGAGAAWSSAFAWRAGAVAAIGLSLLYNLGYITTGLCGYNGYLVDHEYVRRKAETTSAGIPFINANLPKDARVLCVGEAQVFDLRRESVYNTVFDRSIFQEWFGQPIVGAPAAQWPLRDAREIRAKLRKEGITHVYVNWQEVNRYRKTYGYTKFVTRQRFDQLVQAEVLGPSLVADPRFQVFPVRDPRGPRE